jgi:hypothetical protein
VGRSRRSEDNIKIGPVASSCERGNESFDSMEEYNFSSGCYLHKDDYA